MMAEITASLILKRGGRGSPEGAVFLQKYAVTVEEERREGERRGGRGEERRGEERRGEERWERRGEEREERWEVCVVRTDPEGMKWLEKIKSVRSIEGERGRVGERGSGRAREWVRDTKRSQTQSVSPRKPPPLAGHTLPVVQMDRGREEESGRRSEEYTPEDTHISEC